MVATILVRDIMQEQRRKGERQLRELELPKATTDPCSRRHASQARARHVRKCFRRPSPPHPQPSQLSTLSREDHVTAARLLRRPAKQLVQCMTMPLAPLRHKLQAPSTPQQPVGGPQKHL